MDIKNKKILVVVDMQNDFVTGALCNEDAYKIIPDVVEKVRSASEDKNTLVVFTKDTHYDDYMETQEGKNLPVPHCIINTHGWGIIDELKPFADESWTYEKPSFGSVALSEELRRYTHNGSGVEKIEVVGICTDICVLSNVALIKAFLPEVPVEVDAKCCAGVTPETHDTALNAMKAIQVSVVNQGKEAWRR